MKLAVLGTGSVGQLLTGKLASLGHQVLMGTRNVADTASRTKPNQMTGISFSDWHSKNPSVALKNFEDSVQDAEIVINALSGKATLDVLSSIGENRLAGKILIDLANPLDFSKGMPPSLFLDGNDSLGEQIQHKLPTTYVVKTLNTLSANIMVEPKSIEDEHHIFLSGNHAAAKETVKSLLISFGWAKKNILDLGDITTSRGTEQYLALWIRMMSALGTPNFNIKIALASKQ